MQGVDYTTLVAACHELQHQWVPAKVEKIYQRDRYNLYLALRTVNSRGWLLISWHPQAARISLSDAPPRIPDTFTFSDQLHHQLNGLALVDISLRTSWERVAELKFAKRPQDPAAWSLLVEIMNKYSNVILLNQ
ncbi:MAG: NFACT family protein, partial [Cyanobacteria bacterium P01_F01_bin.42]